ncbi:hypothetical protein [Rubritalea tangerina]|uniref:Uncharacterized protein n=1 Tax=Rubritalea tangerina TaxID=430798 RepID=A0ABW4ZGN9_9BACT
MRFLIYLSALSISTCYAESEFQRMYKREHGKNAQETPEQIIENHAKGAEKIAREQDELSADVQELIQGETNGKVIQFLSEAEELMAEATDRLEEKDTSAATIAVETEVIEKIAAAANQKQQSSSSKGQQQSSALMEMMKQMMGQGQEAQSGQEGQEGQQPGSSAGEGQEADSDSANQRTTEKSDGMTSTRKLPKKSGSAGTTLPKEFQKALDAYNRGLDSQ